MPGTTPSWSSMARRAGPRHPILYYANVIDYVRFLLLMVPIFISRKHPTATTILFTMSDVADAFDGMFARKYKQTSFLGCCLDMAIDRAASSIISMTVLRSQPPQFIATFLTVFVLVDITSHWLRFSMALKCHQHHKNMRSSFRLLDCYYGNKVFLTTLCACNETFLISYYCYLESDVPILHKLALLLTLCCAGPFILKMWISVL